ncbi:MAG: hypothetical protein ACRDGL_00240, partial [Candidatus Limnocylindrales bacterium]
MSPLLALRRLGGRAPILLLACLLGLAAWAAVAGPVGAAEPPIPVTPTIITVVQAPTTVVVGTKVSLEVRVTTPDGTPVADARVLLTLDGSLLRGDRSDQNGLVKIDIRDTEIARAHTASLRFTYAGDRTHGASSATRSLVVAAASLRVRTVPAVPGLQFRLGSTTVTSGSDGVATILVPVTGSYLLTPSFDLGPGATSRVSFLRWQDGIFSPARNVHVTGDTELVLGLRVAVQASIQMADEDGRLIPPASIDSMSLSSSDGQTVTLTSFADLWWIAASATSRPEGLASVATVYRVNDVMIAGTNVVNQGQTTWTPTAGSTLTVPVLLFELTVSTRDAFFGWALQGPLELVYPDASVARATVGPSGDVDFGTLPRGQYTLKFHTQGLSPPTPVALSRSQTALIRIVTYLDLAATGATLLLIAVLLIVLGRRHQLVHAYGRARDAALDPRPALVLGHAIEPLVSFASGLDRAVGFGSMGAEGERPAVARRWSAFGRRAVGVRVRADRAAARLASRLVARLTGLTAVSSRLDGLL